MGRGGSVLCGFAVLRRLRGMVAGGGGRVVVVYELGW